LYGLTFLKCILLKRARKEEKQSEVPTTPESIEKVAPMECGCTPVCCKYRRHGTDGTIQTVSAVLNTVTFFDTCLNRSKWPYHRNFKDQFEDH